MDNEERTYRLEQIREAFYETDEYEEVYNEESTDLVIVECQEGHRYKIDYSKESYKRDIVRGCPYCKGYGINIKNKCSYNNNLLSLKTFIDKMGLNKAFDNYAFYDEEGKEKDISELTFCSSKPLSIKLKNENCEDVIYEATKSTCIGDLLLNGTTSKFKKDVYESVKSNNNTDYSQIKNYYSYYENSYNYFITKEVVDIYMMYIIVKSIHILL